MALFKTEEEKAAIAAEKERRLLEKYGLENLRDKKDVESVRKIVQELAGSGLMEMGMKLSLAKAEVQLPISYQRTLMEQNFIMIRQLDKISVQLAYLLKQVSDK